MRLLLATALLATAPLAAADAARPIAFAAQAPQQGALVLPLGSMADLAARGGMLEAATRSAVERALQAEEFGFEPKSTLMLRGIGAYSHILIVGTGSEPLGMLRGGSGIFYNTMRLDVNDAGSVAAQMEYSDPTRGLARGILLFSKADQPLEDVATAVEKLGIGTQPEPSMNGRGEIAFVLNEVNTVSFFDPPHDRSGAAIGALTLEPGVYVASPTPFGLPSKVRQIASTHDGYREFMHVELNDAGAVVFEATVESGGHGVYSGRDPVAHKLIAVGDAVGARRFAWLQLGELNDAGEFVVVTRDAASADRQVWRARPTAR